MVSEEEIKKVKKLQRLEEELENLKEDYSNMFSGRLCIFRNYYDCKFFSLEDYNKELKRIIKHKILKKKSEIKKFKNQ